jgi:hypothetical protein
VFVVLAMSLFVARFTVATDAVGLRVKIGGQLPEQLEFFANREDPGQFRFRRDTTFSYHLW